MPALLLAPSIYNGQPFGRPRQYFLLDAERSNTDPGAVFYLVLFSKFDAARLLEGLRMVAVNAAISEYMFECVRPI